MFSYKKMINNIINDTNILHEITNEEKKIIQKNVLEIMDSIIQVCEKYSFSIMLGGGSALGAVRHQGFIPWDDDLDLNMPREDFEKFKIIFEKELGDRYRLYTPNYDGKAIARFAKVEKKGTSLETIGSKNKHGICIDIFPIENIPKNKPVFLLKGISSQIIMFITGQVEFWENRNDLMRTIMFSCLSGKIYYYIKIIIGFVFSIIPLNKWYDIADSINQYRYTGLMGVPSGRKHYFGEIFNEKVYLPIKPTVFEGHKAYLPHNTDLYLKNLFGDYMKIPSKEKRETHFIISVKE